MTVARCIEQWHAVEVECEKRYVEEARSFAARVGIPALRCRGGKRAGGECDPET